MPLNRAFFVRNIRTLQNKLRILFQHLSTIYSSMVARNRQPFAVGCFPITTVFHPVTFYRPTVESLAVVSKISYWNLHKCINSFLRLFAVPIYLIRFKKSVSTPAQNKPHALNSPAILFLYSPAKSIFKTP